MDANTTMMLDIQNSYYQENDSGDKDNDLHELLFTNSKFEDNQNISYLYSSLYCLTNNKFLMDHFKSLSCDDKDVKSFYDMIINICSDIKDKKVSKSFKAIKDYEKSISFFNDNDPRNFIMNILIKTLQIQYSGKINSLSNSKNSIQNNKKEENEENINQSEPNLFTSIKSLQKNTQEFLKPENKKGISYASTDFENSHIWLNEHEKAENDEIDNTKKDVIIRASTKKHIKGNISSKYRFSCFIQLYLPEDDNTIFTISSGLRNYLNDINYQEIGYEKDNINKVFHSLPETLIFIIFFGKKKDEYPEKCKYKFDEILDFNQPEYKDLFDPEIKFKKYFLSSLIACKFPKIYKKFFYTFCRKEKDSTYFKYNCKESKVGQNQDVKNKLQKLEDSKIDDTCSYPYVLVYNAIKDEK